MWKLLVLLSSAVSQARSLEDAGDLYGEYKSIYTWPNTDLVLPNCSPLVISEAEAAPGSCSCGRGAASLAVVSMEVNSRKFSILLDFVNSADELRRAVGDKCSCGNSGMHHDVVWKLDGEYMVHYETDLARVYLLGKLVPSAGRLRGMVERFYWNDWGGKLLCR